MYKPLVAQLNSYLSTAAQNNMHVDMRAGSAELQYTRTTTYFAQLLRTAGLQHINIVLLIYILDLSLNYEPALA
jgi:hypothetical protein